MFFEFPRTNSTGVIASWKLRKSGKYIEGMCGVRVTKGCSGQINSPERCDFLKQSDEGTPMSSTRWNLAPVNCIAPWNVKPGLASDKSCGMPGSYTASHRLPRITIQTRRNI